MLPHKIQTEQFHTYSIYMHAWENLQEWKGLIRPEFFYMLIYKPSYCNFPESRKKIKFVFYFFFILSANSKY